jgi:hypothetical protein
MDSMEPIFDKVHMQDFKNINFFGGGGQNAPIQNYSSNYGFLLFTRGLMCKLGNVWTYTVYNE